MSPPAPGSFDLLITREFDASPERVFEQWSDPENVGSWFAPDGYAVTSCDFTPRAGESWKVVYASASETWTESGVFLEVDPPRRLVFTLARVGDAAVTLPETTVVVTFVATAGGTRMAFHQRGFDTELGREDHRVGWGQCFDKLGDGLHGPRRTGGTGPVTTSASSREAPTSDEVEIRDVLESRARCIRDKQAEQALRFYAEDVVNFDLAPPLALRGAEATDPTELQRWFDTWEGPIGLAFDQLEIRAADDRGLAFGFLRLTGRRSDGSDTDVWARMTVGLERRSGRWIIVHEHQSFPTRMDGTERSATDLRP